MWGWVYGIKSGEFIKVGVATDIKARLHQFRLHNPHELKVIFRKFVHDPYWFEKRMHHLLNAHAKGREWFVCDVATVKEAGKVVLQELAVRTKEQQAWEAYSATRVEARAGDGMGILGRPSKLS